MDVLLLGPYTRFWQKKFSCYIIHINSTSINTYLNLFTDIYNFRMAPYCNIGDRSELEGRNVKQLIDDKICPSW